MEGLNLKIRERLRDEGRSLTLTIFEEDNGNCILQVEGFVLTVLAANKYFQIDSHLLDKPLRIDGATHGKDQFSVPTDATLKDFSIDVIEKDDSGKKVGPKQKIIFDPNTMIQWETYTYYLNRWKLTAGGPEKFGKDIYLTIIRLEETTHRAVFWLHKLIPEWCRANPDQLTEKAIAARDPNDWFPCHFTVKHYNPREMLKHFPATFNPCLLEGERPMFISYKTCQRRFHYIDPNVFEIVKAEAQEPNAKKAKK